MKAILLTWWHSWCPCRTMGPMSGQKQWQYVPVVENPQNKRENCIWIWQKTPELLQHIQSWPLQFMHNRKTPYAVFSRGPGFWKERGEHAMGGDIGFSASFLWPLPEAAKGEGIALCPQLLWVACIRWGKDKETNLFCMGQYVQLQRLRHKPAPWHRRTEKRMFPVTLKAWLALGNCMFLVTRSQISYTLLLFLWWNFLMEELKQKKEWWRMYGDSEYDGAGRS